MPGARGGPLRGLRILEIGSIGPGPFAGLMLAELGADVLRLSRPDEDGRAIGAEAWNHTLRSRPSIPCDLSDSEGRELALRLADRADALIEGFRPGAMERLGLGPDRLLARNSRLVYGRVTGYGQSGPLAAVAGHDINYIALAGVLDGCARDSERPLAPLNLVGDYGGGAMLLLCGVLSALLEARESGAGQVVDAAMAEGAALMTVLVRSLASAGLWPGAPGTNLLDSGAHFYEVYATADGGHVAVGAVEPRFYAELLRLLDLDASEFPQMDRERWPELKRRFAAIFATRTRAEWAELLETAEACTTVVRTRDEAPDHPHSRARGAFVEVAGQVQPAPAPRFSRTPCSDPTPPADASPEQALAAWGLAAAR